MIRRVSHLGLAVRNLDAALELYQGVFGVEVEHRFESAEDGIRAAMLRVGEIEIELMEPLGEETPVGKFLAKRGEGLHHVCYKVDDVTAALDQAAAAGVESIDTVPRPGGDGRTLVGFLHPRGMMGVLTELEEDVT